MKKFIITSVLAYAILCPAISAIVSNPIISRGKSVFTSSGAAQYLVDNKFNTTKWSVTNGSWIAIHLDAGPSSIFINWNNPVYAWSNELSPSKCPNYNSFPVDYNFLISSNSTDGVDGEWTIADSVRDNIVTARGHLIDFSGASWLKMEIIQGGGQLDEVEIFDASSGYEDVWFFAGTSISANTFKGTPPAQNFADLVAINHPEYNPAMIRGGIGCISSTDFVYNLSKYLKMAGNTHFWAIEMGTNDAWGGTNDNVTTFKNNLQTVVDSCKAYGIEPIIARVLATNPVYSSNGWQVHPDYLLAVDDLTAQNNLIAGPDLYTWFLAHPEELGKIGDGVHPNVTGAASIHRLWAQKMDSLYGGCYATEIIPYMQTNLDTMTIIASVVLNVGDSAILSPQAADDGSWSWIGPDGFSSITREVSLNNLQLTQAGTYTVTYTNTDTCTSTYNFKITLLPSPVEITFTDKSGSTSIFPNPANEGTFRVLLNNLSTGSQLNIYNLQGKLVYNSILTKNVTEINAGLSEGIYIIKIINEHNILTQKLIVR